MMVNLFSIKIGILRVWCHRPAYQSSPKVHPPPGTLFHAEDDFSNVCCSERLLLHCCQALLIQPIRYLLIRKPFALWGLAMESSNLFEDFRLRLRIAFAPLTFPFCHPLAFPGLSQLLYQEILFLFSEYSLDLDQGLLHRVRLNSLCDILLGRGVNESDIL